MANQFYRVAKQEHTCEICGKTIIVGEQCYIRDGIYSTVRCMDCHSKKLDKWEKSRHVYDLLLEKVLDCLVFNEVVNEEQLVKIAGSQKSYEIVLKRLIKSGYTIVPKGNGTIMIKGVPSFSSFITELIDSDSEDYDNLYQSYRSDWYWTAKQILQDNHVEPPRYKNCIGDFVKTCKLLKYYDLSKYVSGTYYFSRISEDKKVYEDVCRDNREYVLLFLIEEVFANCVDITNCGFGKIEYRGQKKTYSIMLDESQISDETGSDYDILITAEGIDCFTEDDVLDFCDCFHQQNNEHVKKMVNFIQNLLRSGF